FFIADPFPKRTFIGSVIVSMLPDLLIHHDSLESLDAPPVKKFLLALALIMILPGCVTQQPKLYWRVKDVVLEKNPRVELYKPDQQIALTISTRTIQEMMLAHLRICRSAGVQSELYIVDGDEPNAFAGFVNNSQPIIGINLAMVKVIGDQVDEYAALIGHEAAHWAKGHANSSQTRTSTLNALGTLVGVGLGAAGVPAAGLISGLGVDLIDSSYSRDQEREADAQSIDYLLANNYDPQAAVTLQEKFLKIDRGLSLPFLSTHPSSEERIENLKAIIAAKLPQRH
ncbi:MAG TPA: M48 family metalloprotease, partial [Terriglobales bacterium]|nr:M48 family metalloprotease [Terriglobales bacterium]